MVLAYDGICLPVTNSITLLDNVGTVFNEEAMRDLPSNSAMPTSSLNWNSTHLN